MNIQKASFILSLFALAGLSGCASDPVTTTRTTTTREIVPVPATTIVPATTVVPATTTTQQTSTTVGY